MNSHAPYFPFYAGDWLSDPNVQQLTLEESGAYITLLAYMWTGGEAPRIPDDNDFIARILHVSPGKWASIREVIVDGPMPVFRRTDDGHLVNRRLEAEYAKISETISKRSDAAKKRWSGADKTACKTDASALHMQPNASALHVHMQTDAIKDLDPDLDLKQEQDQDRDQDKNKDQDQNLSLSLVLCREDQERERERSTRAHTREVVQAYEEVCGPLRGEPSQLLGLVEYLEHGMEAQIIVHALRRSATAHHPVRYADAILRSYQRGGITTLAQALEAAPTAGGAGYGPYPRVDIPGRGYARTKSITGGRVGCV